MRLMDADALTEKSEAVTAFCGLFKECGMKHTSACLAPNCENCVARFFKHYEHLMPTIDAEPVKHGYWIVKEIEHCLEYDATCSCCGFTFADNYDGYVDTGDCLYCMNCGAKMDEN